MNNEEVFAHFDPESNRVYIRLMNGNAVVNYYEDYDLEELCFDNHVKTGSSNKPLPDQEEYECEEYP